jgi:hypothetical protein
VAPHLEQYGEDPAKAVERLTTAIQWGMEAQVLQVDRIDATEIVRAVEELYRDDLVRQLQVERGLSPAEIDTFRLSRTIVAAVRHFREREPERVESLWQRIRAYRTALAECRVRDQAVRARVAGRPARSRIQASWQAVVGFPVFVYGATVNGLPYFGPRWLSRWLARKETDYATVRLLISVVAFPLFWGGEIWFVWWVAGLGWAVGFALSLPLTGLVAYHYSSGLGRLRAQLRLGILALTQHHAASRLLTERQAILAELEQAKDDYLAATAPDERI